MYDANGNLLAFNDNWRDAQEGELVTSGLAPPKDPEPAILIQLPPGAYTAIVRGAGGTTGVALLELFGLE